ncbi:hypothetical protein AUR64_10985 [Haloprofundus marisrubri]|uniref:Fenitrothion hydrolase n=1 Tax=Haloprofundus marisrubri TaxID=1514971 RepID=A0A0W1R9V4_9EURY|nr:hypothetical protein [Haloprofundus marisrubri]KTG10113.1 hypothetical protein AUR64_10985 [Haloprofundus marisrubri]
MVSRPRSFRHPGRDERSTAHRFAVSLSAFVVAVAVSLSAFVAAAGVATAHAGAVRSAAPGTIEVPTWLFLLTGGGAVGASFLLASFVTDRRFIRSIHDWGGTLPSPGRLLRFVGRFVGVAILLVTVYVGFVGPDTQLRNLAILVVWVGWWGGYVASVYLIGNTWPTLNPFRTLAELLPSLDREYPERYGAWPAVVGLLALIFVEVVAPIGDEPQTLAAVIVAYMGVSFLGSVVFGSDRWFDTVDPISRTFEFYGHAAPIARTDDGLQFRLPGAGLSEAGLVVGRDQVAFVVAVLYVTTYDGFVGTNLWAGFVIELVGFGMPPLLGYLLVYLVGFLLFLRVYWWSARLARRYGDTYYSVEYLAERFAPSLLAIAAGYHLAHNLGVMLSLSPTLLDVGGSTLVDLASGATISPPQNPLTLASLPSWFSGLELFFVLLGHLVAVWVAHAVAYDLFPDRLQAVHSQYGVTAVMVLYTMVSLWIVSEPPATPPYL